MEVMVTNTEGNSAYVKPCKGSYLKEDDKTKCWFVSIETFEDLLKIVKEKGEIIIGDGIMADNLAKGYDDDLKYYIEGIGIEIYNGYRE